MRWLRLILDEDLNFVAHWESGIGQARKFLGALDGMRTCRCGMSPLSWWQTYTGIIGSVPL